MLLNFCNFQWKNVFAMKKQSSADVDGDKTHVMSGAQLGFGNKPLKSVTDDATVDIHDDSPDYIPPNLST